MSQPQPQPQPSPRPPADSADVPWSGRTLPPGGFEGDDGEADPLLSAALVARSAGDGADADVVAALVGSRLLVPVVAVLGEGAQTSHGTSDKQADMAVVTLTGPDGRRALPVFSSVASLAAWDASARPVPTDCRRAAVSAVAEGCDVMVLDPGGPVPFVVSRPALWAIGQGRRWLPAHQDPQVRAVLEAVTGQHPQVTAVQAEPGLQAELAVVLTVAPGLDGVRVQALAQAVGAALQADALLRERVDGLELRLTTG